MNKNRPKAVLNSVGYIEVVAQWADKVPMIATRYDLPGLITSIGYEQGSSGSLDGLEVIVNALCLIR